MNTPTRAMALGLLLAASACRVSPRTACHATANDLRTRVDRLQWSRVDFSVRFPYDDVPKGDGRTLPWGYLSTVAIDGKTVEMDDLSPPAAADLERWLALEGDRHTILHPSRSEDDPIFLMATAKTKVSMVRRVIAALEPYAVIRLVVRPTTAEEPSWRPAPERQPAFDAVTRESSGRPNFEGEIATALEAAAGCSKAVDLVSRPGMYPIQRLRRVADVFEGCHCAGDMETLAALYWWMTFGSSRTARWLPWDSTVAVQLGDDATYEQLVREMIAREKAEER